MHLYFGRTSMASKSKPKPTFPMTEKVKSSVHLVRSSGCPASASASHCGRVLWWGRMNGGRMDPANEGFNYIHIYIRRDGKCAMNDCVCTLSKSAVTHSCTMWKYCFMPRFENAGRRMRCATPQICSGGDGLGVRLVDLLIECRTPCQRKQAKEPTT